MTLDTHNWSSSAHQELHKIIKDEIFPIVNQVDARVQNFEIQFLKEAAKFVGDFKSLAKEADESLAKHKALELEINRLLRAVVSQDIMSGGTSANTKFAKQSVLGKPPKVGETHALSKLVTSNSIPTPQGSKVVKNVKKQKANVSINEKQKKQQPKVKKTKKVGSIEILDSPKPSKPSSFLRRSPTGRLFELKGKIIASSESESQSDCSKGDNACTSNPLEPTIKRFPNSTSFLASYPNMFMVRRLGLFQAHDWKSKPSHQLRLEVFGNCSLWK
nr:hypothetical protein [Tanacetum cinerariifolium]